MSNPDIRAALDTSVVVRLLTGQPRDLSLSARAYLAGMEQEGAKVFVSNLVVLEACFACQHHYDMEKADVLAGLRTLLAMPTFVVHPHLLPLLATEGLATAKPGFLDRLIHAEAAAAGLTLITFEKAAASLPQTQILNAPPPSADRDGS